MYRKNPDIDRVDTAIRFPSARPETNIGTFGDVETARAYIRAQGLNVGMSSDIVASISGTSRLTSTTAFDPGDSGSNGYYVVYRGTNAAGSSRTLGSSVVTGWVQYSGGIYRANVGTGLDIQTMWEDGVRARKARSPKLSSQASYPLAQDTYRSAEGVAASSTVLQYISGDYSPGSWSLTDAQVFIWTGGTLGAFGAIAWFSDTTPIASLNLGARQFTLSQSTRYSIFNATGGRYYIQGVLDLLTEAREFHYDSTAGYLYYYFSGNPSTAVVEIPRVTNVFNFLGDDETTRCRYIQLDNLGIEQSNFTSWYRFAWPNAGDAGGSHTYPEYDRVKAMPQCRGGLVYMQNADHIKITRCKLKNAGLSGIFLEDYNQSHSFESNLIEDIGDSGIYFDGKYPAEGDVLKSCAVYNTTIQNVGQLVGHGSGLFIINSGSHTIQNCTIAGSPRMGIFIGAGVVDLPASATYSSGNLISYTRVTDCCQDSGDAASIDIGLINSRNGGPYETNTLTQVIVDGANASPSMLDRPPSGVYTDNQSWNQVFSNVQVTNTQGPGMFINDSGGHTATNCTFNADGTTNGSFNAALIDTANIGVNGASVVNRNPYA